MQYNNQYYDLIESTGYHLIIFGEMDERWTNEVLDLFENAGLTIDLFVPWGQATELRLQLELLYYPTTQLWHNGCLIAEVAGYHNESLKNLIEKIK